MKENTKIKNIYKTSTGSLKQLTNCETFSQTKKKREDMTN